MAHGTPIINICYDCNQYTLVPRFSEDPICPTCGKPSEQTTKEQISERYWIGFFYDWKLNFGYWEKITEQKR